MSLLHRIALTRIPLVGAVTARTLVSYCGGVEAVFEASRKELQAIPGIGEQIARSICTHRALEEAEQELAFLERHDIRALFYLDADYPERLKPHHDAPVLLFVKGAVNLNHPRMVAVIGTRTPTPHGRQVCREIIEDLAPFQPLIVSGLAYGIDVAAHQAALDCGLPTVAVLGHGLGRIYPPSHRRVALKMVEEGGGLLTEFASSVGPDRENFPMRNRIIAALCDALVVVETAERGGSMITARFAAGYAKDIFAVPGRPKDARSAGCNLLIRNNQAILLQHGTDIAAHLGWNNGRTPLAEQAALWSELSEGEKKVLDVLQEVEESGVDLLLHRTGLSSAELAAVLLELELKGLIRTLPGKRYVLG